MNMTLRWHRWFAVWVFLLSRSVHAEVYECPDDWIHFGVKCYRFVMYPELNHDSARAQCGDHGASLVGINSQSEHQFISGWLMNNDLSRGQFHTSGLVRSMADWDLVWESDGSPVSPDIQFWLTEEDRLTPGQFITYKYGVTTYGWSRVPGNRQLPFMCEVSQDQAYRITEEERDFDYGLGLIDPNEVPRGPKFTKQPENLLLVDGVRQVMVECAVHSVPSSEYKMYRTLISTGETTLITPSSRYALTNGRLTVSEPTEREDAGEYFCEASNPSGTVVSQSGHLSFGLLATFSNVQREKVRVVQHSFGIIDCLPPNYRPDVFFAWMKNTPGNFIRTDLNPHIFVSSNGKLYFSEVDPADAAVYYCMVKLLALPGSTLATSQPPTSVSLPIELEVTHSLPLDWGPEIGNDFIGVYPREPLRGQLVRMECLAYGTMPIFYEWTREDLPMPINATFSEQNRVLELPGVQLEDSGTYVCRASRANSGVGGAFDTKSVRLSIQALSYFIYELHDLHVDEGRRLSWRCEARGQPAPTYHWLKNGVMMDSVAGDVEISANVLTIVSPDSARHDGMYQCAATNAHGTAYSTGQLRVLGFAPTFMKNPVHSKTMGALGGNVTIICSPEAAPVPTITWTKNGAAVGSPDAGARVRVLSNGNIVISQLVMSDAGTYTCLAENSYGAESSDGVLEVLARTTISSAPANTAVRVNSTAFLACQASHDPALDLVTAWYFQGRSLNWRDVHYRKGAPAGISGLYVLGAQKKHSGIYSCQAKSSFDYVMVNATLTVRGPPSEPAGAMTLKRSGLDSLSVILSWTNGATWGAPISYYTIQVMSDHEGTWTTLLDDVSESSTVSPAIDRREVTIEGLKPWTAYKFRVRGRNIFGNGPYSRPSGIFQTPTAPPVRAPANITAGGGKVGTLNITWMQLPSSEHGGPGIGYNVYHRLHSRPNDRWIKADVGDVRSHVDLVGRDLFYTLYDVMVQPYNDVGPGPNSSVANVYSAEGMPMGTPTNVEIVRHNATALRIIWEPVQDTRNVMKGKIQGYQINYWEDVSDPQILNHYTGEAASSALVIGLMADTWYIMDVQVYNTAGLGPRSEKFKQRTLKNEIKSQPTEITVSSHGPDSVFVTWRGVSVKPNEESLQGYVMQYWPATDNIRTAQGVFTGLKNSGVISGLQKNVIYKLRVYPYSRGGDGGSSPDRLFTLGGQIYYDPTSTEVLASGNKPTCCAFLILMGLLASLFH